MAVFLQSKFEVPWRRESHIDGTCKPRVLITVHLNRRSYRNVTLHLNITSTHAGITTLAHRVFIQSPYAVFAVCW